MSLIGREGGPRRLTIGSSESDRRALMRFARFKLMLRDLKDAPCRSRRQSAMGMLVKSPWNEN